MGTPDWQNAPNDSSDESYKSIDGVLRCDVFMFHLPFFKSLLADNETKIPDVMVHSDSENPDVKVRTGWFTAVSVAFQLLDLRLKANKIEISPSRRSRMDNFVNFVEHTIKTQRMNGNQDIELAIKTLHTAINILEIIQRELWEKEKD